MSRGYFKIYLFVFFIGFGFLTANAETSEIREKSGGKDRAFQIAVIHSYAPGMWTHEGTAGVQSALKMGGIKAKVHEYIYDFYAYLGKGKLEEQKKVFLKKIRGLRPDAIIIFDDEATDVLLPALNKLGIPIIVSAYNKTPSDIPWWQEKGAPGRNFTGVFERYPFSQSIKMLNKINPKISKISILSGNNDSAKIIYGQLIDFLKRHEKDLPIKLDQVFASSKWKDWQKYIREYKGEDKAFWIVSPWNIEDENGKEMDLRKIGAFYRKYSDLPSLGIVSVNQQLGFLASFAISSEDLGVQAGEMALQVLLKKKMPRDMEFVPNSTVRFVINKKRVDQLKYKIPMDLLEFATIEKKIPMNYVR